MRIVIGMRSAHCRLYHCNSVIIVIVVIVITTTARATLPDLTGIVGSRFVPLPPNIGIGATGKTFPAHTRHR